ncbi:MAG: Hsp20 family protein [Alphaproteobacteria bacterium]|nr:Hsp20 family protein [Alphaproteobacteria bacterium]
MSTGRLTLFDSPLFLGFDEIEKTFDRMRKSGGEGYPPYNIEQIGESDLRISLAVAGFSMDELDIEVENNQLVIRGRQADEEDRIYIHRGIAARQFQRSFVLADGIEVRDAMLDKGLLHIELERVVPESKARKIHIKGEQKKPTNGSAQKAIGVDKSKTDDSSD